MAIEHTPDTSSTNAILVILLVLIALVLGYFLFRGYGNSTPSTIDVNLPNILGTDGGGTTGGTQ